MNPAHVPDLESIRGESLINRVAYYWDWYKLRGEPDMLAAAVSFLKSFRDIGGIGHEQLEHDINAAVAAIVDEPTKLATRPPVAPWPLPEPETEPTIFGYPWSWIEAKQQGVL